jgi:hypothetical protein
VFCHEPVALIGFVRSAPLAHRYPPTNAEHASFGNETQLAPGEEAGKLHEDGAASVAGTVALLRGAGNHLVFDQEVQLSLHAIQADPEPHGGSRPSMADRVDEDFTEEETKTAPEGRDEDAILWPVEFLEQDRLRVDGGAGENAVVPMQARAESLVLPRAKAVRKLSRVAVTCAASTVQSAGNGAGASQFSSSHVVACTRRSMYSASQARKGASAGEWERDNR